MRYDIPLYKSKINIELLRHIYNIQNKEDQYSYMRSKIYFLKTYNLSNLKDLEDDTFLSELVDTEENLNAICLSTISSKNIFTEIDTNMFDKNILKLINQYPSNISILAYYLSLLKNNFVNEELLEKFNSIIDNLDNLSKQELFLILPLLYEINLKTNNLTKKITELLEKLELIEVLKHKKFLKDFSDIVILYSAFSTKVLKKQYFKNSIYFDLIKLFNKLINTCINDKDIQVFINAGVPKENLIMLNYYCAINSDEIFLSSKNNLITNYIICNILSEEDLNNDILKLIEKFSENYSKFFEKVYKHLAYVKNKRTFNLLINNQCFSIYLLNNYIDLLKNPLSSNLSEKSINYCINQCTKNNFKNKEDLDFYIDFIKNKNKKVESSYLIVENLVEFGKIDFENINSIDNIDIFIDKIKYHQEIVSYYFKNYSLDKFLNFKDNFSILEYEVLSTISINTIIENTIYHNKEFLSLYLETIYCFKPKEYSSILVEILFHKNLVEILDYSLTDISRLIDILTENHLVPIEKINELSLIYNKLHTDKHFIKDSKELEEFVKENIHKTNWNNIIQEYIDNLVELYVSNLMTIYFMLKKHNKLNNENLCFIEKKIYKLQTNV